MFLPLENMLCLPAFIILLIQLFSSFGKLNGIELPLQLLHANANANGENSMSFAHRLAFPSDNDVELPPNVEDNIELNTPKGFAITSTKDNENTEYDLPMKSEMPEWLKLQIQPEAQQHAKHHNLAVLPKHIQGSNHQHTSHPVHSSLTTSAAGTPLQRCSIEISNKISGICQAMGSVGPACVSGDYIDVFNSECL